MPRLSILCLQAGSGGALYALGQVGFGIWPLIFIYLIPFWLALERIGAGHSGKAALVGLVFGLSAFAVGFPWLLELIGGFLGGNLLTGLLLWSACGIWFAIGFAAYAVAFRRLRLQSWPLALAGSAPLLLVEWLQPQLFPSFAGAALIQVLPLAQIADLGGPLLLTAVVALVNACFYQLWLHLRGTNTPLLRHTVLTSLLVSGVILYGIARTQSLAKPGALSQPLRVGLVQANLGGQDKRRFSAENHRRHLQQSRELIDNGTPDLIVWPETAYTRAIRRPLPVDAQTIREDLPLPLLFGGTSVWEENGKRRSANSAFLVTAAGKIHHNYDKNLLIPLAEYMPFSGVGANLKTLLPHMQNFSRGNSAAALQLGEIAIATPICYEVIVPDFVRKMVREAHPQLLITLASDAWFGNTQGPHIHLAFARLRAIEHRLWLIRATSTGISAFIDPAGRVTARTGLFTRENLYSQVYTRAPSTLYARLGNWPGWAALFVVLVAVCLPYRLPTGRRPAAA